MSWSCFEKRKRHSCFAFPYLVMDGGSPQGLTDDVTILFIAACNIPKPEDHRDKEQEYLEMDYDDNDGDEYEEDEERGEDVRQEEDDGDDEEVEGLYNDEDFDMYLKSSRGQLSIGKAAKKLPGLVFGIGAKV